MEKKKYRRMVSLSQVYKGIILAIIPVLMIGIVAALSLGKSIQQQSLEVLRGNMNLQVKNLEEVFHNINYCLMSNLNANENMTKIWEAEDIYQRYKAIRDLKNDFEEFRYYFGSDYNFFAYELTTEEFHAATPKNMEYRNYLYIQKAVRAYISKETKEEFLLANRKWNLVTTENGIEVLLKIYENQGKMIGCWVLLDTIERIFGVNEYSNSNNFMFLVLDGEILTNQEVFEQLFAGKKLAAIMEQPRKSLERNDFLYYDFHKASFGILNIVDTIGNYDDNLQILFGFIMLLCIVIGVGIFLLYYIRNKLIRPIHIFVDHLQEANEEEFYTEELRFTELKQVDELFQKAKRQIKELKIEIYEQQLQKQKLEEDYFQIQIRPHFYLNCLHIIYSMAQTKRFEEIQKLSMEVSNYMRTLFRSGMDLVPVKDEMEHLKGYLNIQEFRYTDSFTYKVQVDETIQDYKILPLIIHTIVENSIKHSIMKQNIIHIDISVTQVFQDGEAYIKVLVWDTGDGFGEDVLAELQSKQKLVSKGGQRIGLTNLIQRLEYVYEKRASIQFANRKSGGAEVQIMIPACR